MTKTTSLEMSNKREDFIDLSVIREDIKHIVNQQVLEALEKLKEHETTYEATICNQYHLPSNIIIARAVPLSAIEQLEKEYRK